MRDYGSPSAKNRRHTKTFSKPLTTDKLAHADAGRDDVGGDEIAGRESEQLLELEPVADVCVLEDGAGGIVGCGLLGKDEVLGSGA